jgi:ankyrin repeat protein
MHVFFLLFLKKEVDLTYKYGSKSFTSDVTPLILAAHKDNYEIIKILLDRGEQIPEPVNFFV